MEKDVTEPIKNQLLDQYPLMEFLLANLASMYGNLNFEICEAMASGEELRAGRVYIFATPDKGHPDEEASLEAMESVRAMIEEWGFSFDPLSRNTPNGDRVDCVRVWL